MTEDFQDNFKASNGGSYHQICKKCGSLVDNSNESMIRHVKWHQELAETAQSAYRADMWMTPIG